jgi:Nitrate reductase delta subunit
VTGTPAELLRALGAVAGDPADARTVLTALGLPPCPAAEHTEVFVLNCPPYAAVYLGAEGGLGGEAADRVAGFWRAIGTGPPAEPDHLSALLGLYASLGDAQRSARSAGLAEALGRARDALFWEHLWPWLPGYLAAVSALRTPALTAWAALTSQVVTAERAAHPGGWLPLALRSAPDPLVVAGDLAGALTTPVRAGFILTRQRLAAGAAAAGTGCRIGERRFTLRAMLDQAPAETLHWLGGEAASWSGRHAAAGPADVVQRWWARRARHTARVLHGR